MWLQLKGPPIPEPQDAEPQPELTPAAAAVWQDLMEARAIAGREPLGGAPTAPRA